MERTDKKAATNEASAKITDAEVVATTLEAVDKPTETKKTDGEDTTTDAAPATKAEKTETTPVSNLATVNEDTNEGKPLIAFIAGILVAVGGWYLIGLFTPEPAPEQPEKVYPAVVATIDGEPIDRELFEQSLSQNLALAAVTGRDATDPAVLAVIESEALESVINTRLLVDTATAAGYEVTEEAVDRQLAVFIDQAGGPEAFAAQVREAGITDEQLRTDIAEQLIVDQYLRTEVVTNAAPTEADIQAFYDEAIANGQELPALESVRGNIALQLTQAREQELVLTHLETLREAAEIEVNL